ncbi:MAG TPA: hypothetical protein VNV85_00785 [Puia sp.]|jgi:hypothetical protein|nr:hypothetical protein [Puia sp.]
MKSNTENSQGYLAEQFCHKDKQVIQESKIAVLKIQSWQFASRTPGIRETYLKEAAKMVSKSLLSFVPNSFVLSEEGYYFYPVEN